MEGQRVKLTEVNPYLVCVLCHGYLVDATTIAECLHSFCRSCIFRQLERKSICPICETHVHNTKLYRSLRPDKTLQDIVYKLVPGLFHNEMQRRRDFYKNHPFRDEHLEPECRGVGLDRLIYSPDDQISLSLEFYDDEREKEEWSNNSSPKPPQIAPSGPKRYLQCPAGFKMLHLKKFLRQKYGLSPSCNVDIMYRRECLPDSYSLMDVAYIYTWKRNSPMRFYYRMPEIVMKQLTASPPEIPLIENAKEEKKDEGKEIVLHSPAKNSLNRLEESKEENKNENTDKDKKAHVTSQESLPDKGKGGGEKNENVKPITEEVKQQDGGSGNISTSRPLSKQDELSVSVLLSLGQCRVGNKDDHKFLVPHPVGPKNGITEKRNGKLSPKPSVNKIAAELAEHKAQQPQSQNPNPQISQNLSPSSPNQPLNPSPQQKQHQLQQLQQQQQKQHHKQQLKNQQLHQQKQQQLLQQKQQMQQLIQQQQQQQKLQQQFQQQQHLIQQQQLQQIHLQQVQRHQLQQIQSQQSLALQPAIQVQQQQQLQQVVSQIKETKSRDQQSPHQGGQQQPTSDQPSLVSNQVQQGTNHPSQIIKIPQISPGSQHSQLPATAQQQQHPTQQPGQQPQPQQQQQQQSPQHKKSWPEPPKSETTPLNGNSNVQNPQVTLNTSNGSVTIMAQLKSSSIVPASPGVTASSPGSPAPTMNGKPPDTPRPQGIHQNLPRTVLPKTSFVNGKPIQKPVQQKNISGQRLNNNLPEGKNGLIQQSNINNRLPTFQKNGGSSRKTGIPGGVISKTGPTLDQRIQQLYNSGQANKPPSPGGKSESRLASWLNNRFKAQPTKEEPDSTLPSPQNAKETSMQRYKRKLQEMQKVQEICEITQENPKPDDVKRRREVTPDVSIELMRAADMKKLDPTKKEKRPMPGLKSIQEVGAKRKKEEDSALDLSKPGDMLRPQLPWLMSRPPHYIPRPT